LRPGRRAGSSATRPLGYRVGCERVNTDVRRLSGERDDHELLRASREGRGGFDVFYRRHRDAVLAFHAHRVAEPELAADLTAETFAAALLAVHDADRAIPEVPVAWLFTIAHRKLIDSYRRGTVEAVARRRLALAPLVVEDEDIERIVETARTTDVAVELARRLPLEQFQALKARVLDERDYADIAGELGCSEVVVRMRVSRALKALRTATEAHRD
jgi:RNA polymerase sigma factor (sigma-70 family)